MSRETGFAYDGNDNLIALAYASGRTVRYEYDQNRISRIYPDGDWNHPYATEFKYHPSGALWLYRSGNGLYTQAVYDGNRYWPTSVDVGVSPNDVRQHLGYDQ